jgi:pilus assembly protein Flp/PilA
MGLPFLVISNVKGAEIILSSLVELQAMAAGLRNDRGATAVEYALMVALIAVIIIVAVALVGTNLKGIFNKTATSV